MLETLDSAVLFFLNRSNLNPEFIDHFLHIIPGRSRPDPLNIKVPYLFIDDFIVVAGADLLTCRRIDNSNIESLVDSFDHLPEYHTFLGPHLFFILFYLCPQRLFLFFCPCTAPGER